MLQELVALRAQPPGERNAALGLTSHERPVTNRKTDTASLIGGGQFQIGPE